MHNSSKVDCTPFFHLKKPPFIIEMAENGILDYQGMNQAIYRGATSNIVVDTQSMSIEIGAGNTSHTSNLHFECNHDANVASIKLNSNVTTEFSRSKKLIKYPRVAMSQNDESGTSGYVTNASSWENQANNETYGPWNNFNGILNDSAWQSYPRRFSQTTGDWDGTTTAPYAISLVGGTTIYGEWVELKIPNKIQLHTCRISPLTSTTYPNLGKHRSPRSGYILGRVGATGNWTVLKSWSDVIHGWEDLVLRDFDIENPSEYYDYFRVVWTAINGNNNYSTSAGAGYASSGEIEFLGLPEYDPGAYGTDVTIKSKANVPNTDWLEVYYDAKDLENGAVTSVSDLKPSSLGTALNSSSTNNITVSDNAFVFNGTDSYIKIDDLTNPSGAWVHSVAAWINPLDLGGNFELTWIGDVESATTRQSFTFNTSVQVTMGINGSNVKFGFVSPLTKNKWHHVVYTFNGGAAGSDSTAYRVFVDGVEVYKSGGVNSGTLTLPAQTALWIGRNHGGSNYFNGKIANLRLFNRALTTDEIYQLYDYQKEYFGHSTNNMTLKAGRLGIGTSEPRAALDVRGDMYGGCPVFWFASSSSTSGFLNYNQIHVNKGGGIQGDKFIAPISGYYHMTLHHLGNTGTGRTHRLEWFLNGEELGYDGLFGLYATTGTNAHYQNIAGSLIWYMNVGDYMQVNVKNHSMNGNLNGWSGFFLST
tara:strand:+ start:61 stop:2169 length:2109 start_codon:yes stop_codon:yes gene_type:complete